MTTDIPKIKGIPEVPGALPIVGHLLELGDDHATVCEVRVSRLNQKTVLTLSDRDGGGSTSTILFKFD